jgi:uncharacterized repeat protein (TIGR03803 family)
MPFDRLRVTAQVAWAISGVFAVGMASQAWADPSFSTLYNFSGGATGSFPDAPLTVDASGTYYGTTYQGGVAGQAGCGSVFKLAQMTGVPGRTETIIHHFNCADGRNPDAPLLLGADGALYGTTFYGGSNDLGVVFRLTRPASGESEWRETVLYSFTGYDGENPVGRLVQDSDGAIYGVTESGGADLLGNIFKLSPPTVPWGKWTCRTIFSFSYETGNSPAAGLLMDRNGALYGTTSYNGPGLLGEGVVYQLIPPRGGQGGWSYNVLHAFGLDPNDGNAPESDLIMDAGGALYGTTTGGGPATDQGGNAGTIFKLTPPSSGQTGWTETQLYGFSGGQDGSTPFAPLVMDKTGALYGTSSSGGSDYSGTIFKLTPPAKGKTSWVFSTVHEFDYDDGDYPAAGLTLTQNGALVGTTADGGNGYGTAFRLIP